MALRREVYEGECDLCDNEDMDVLKSYPLLTRDGSVRIIDICDGCESDLRPSNSPETAVNAVGGVAPQTTG